MRTTDDSLNDTYVHSLTTHLASELVNGFRVQKGLDLQFLVLAMTAALSRWKPLTSGETLALRDIMEYLDLMHHDMIYPQLGISATDPVGLMYDGILARLRSSLNDPANRPIPLPPPAFEACRICQSAIIVNNDVEVLNEDGTVTRVSEGVGPETGAVCENGHMWGTQTPVVAHHPCEKRLLTSCPTERCVSTYFILDQPCTRACMNCENGSLSLASRKSWKHRL
ncbi:hypothetical protein DFS34DRAFT_46671 [Phlyctochytrium arcticum]|nr:hypothetical protein DFS34DRAFT_46671 [Phlyctochytrium arcticum]